MSKKTKYKDGMVVHPGVGERIADVVIWAVLILCMFIAIVPMWHTVMTSLSDGQLVIAHNGILWKWLTQDGEINWEGYKKTLNYSNFAIVRSYGITLVYVVGNVLLGLVMNVIAGYCLFRKSKLNTFMTLFILFTMMFSGGTVPTYMVIRKLGMTGTIWSLIVPSCTNAMFIVMTMNAYKQVPYSTVESAELDGAGHFTIMFKILLPQAMGLITVCMINTAIMTWNAWFEASIYVPATKAIWPLQLWIKQIVADNESILQAATPDWNKYLVSYCVIIVATVPVLLCMPFAQKQLQKGSLMGAVKE
jgi:putative aldouronate transport system permease protein